MLSEAGLRTASAAYHPDGHCDRCTQARVKQLYSPRPDKKTAVRLVCPEFVSGRVRQLHG